jgi:DNA-binding Lrp family transcriptional regulator
MNAIVLIKMNTGDLRDAYSYLKRLRPVAEAHLTFGPYDILAIIQTDELSAIGRIVLKEIQLLPGVVETCTCLMVDSEVLENVQVAVDPAGQLQTDDLDYPHRRDVKSKFGWN